MIHIFFVPGMFGSSLEYVLRNFTNEYSKIEASILPDGSMHSFVKEFHPLSVSNLSFYQLPKNAITTPIYPCADGHLDEIISKYTLNNDDHYILIYASDLRDAELNCLFQYYKIVRRNNTDARLDVLFDNNSSDFQQWNKNYKSWKDMQRWELREWFSIFYPSWVTEWISSADVVPPQWKKIINHSFLTDTIGTFRNVMNFCNLTEDQGLIDFSAKWRSAQQYVIDEFNLLDQIVLSTLHQQNFNWTNLNIISESIVQQRLRSKGYELMCNDLNTFPTSSEDLYKLLVKV